ncbi:hypothetical protein HUT16_16705 [Kitasatospora sp. NA04385]|uniref:hypothetical protein n=1 Tax=Kitasatospora sp. NA04385 TaxID=2742135 RepID=UPI001592A171|nr:hypothetical protein [Kitasatospora sp. NA04385]QKW20491.1 hypothetical protein HUT16_16705 [Kitasatospora sp. NA04385]
MSAPHEPYFEAVLAALGDLAEGGESFTQFDSDDGEVMLTEIYISVPRGPVGLVWTQVIGWHWGYVNDDGFLNNTDELVLGLVATPDIITAAVHALLTGDSHLLPLSDPAPEPTADQLTPDLARAVEEGDIDHTTAAQLSYYA